MTVSDLHALTAELISDGHGEATVVMSTDPEGNGFRQIGPADRCHSLDRIAGKGGLAGEMLELASGGKPNAVCLWPE